MKQYVQHISGQGEKWRVTTGGEFETCWNAISSSGQVFNLPKSEYRLCDPPEEWEDVTNEYVTNGLVISNNLMYFQSIPITDRIRKINHLHNGPCFIVERKKS